MKLKTINTMKYIFILLLGLITFQVTAQTKIIGSTTTAGGDLQGTYPNPTVKSNIINRANLTASLRDSLLRFRKDTSIIVGSGTTNYSALANTFGKYNRVRITCLLPTAGTASVVLPSLADTLKNTEFKVTLYAQDSVGAVMNVVGFDGFAFWFDGTSINEIEPIVYLFNRQTITLKGVYQNSSWSWLSEVSRDWIGTALAEEAATGITALTGDVTASGTGSVSATIVADAVTSAKILNSTIVSADIASQTIDSLDVKNSSITTVKLETGAVTSAKVLDNSLTGSDLTYLTLRAGTTSNASLQLTSGLDKTTLAGGEILYNGRFAVGIGSSKRRLATTNDANASNGQIPVGNGTDYTNATLTPTYGLDITNASGSITVSPDTTELIPYISSGEIQNGTRDGYFRSSTFFGNQFYHNGYTALHSNLFTTSGSTQEYLYDGVSTVTHQLSLTSGNIPTYSTSVANASETKTTQLSLIGFKTQSYYLNLPINSQAVATYQVDGESSLEHITDNTVTAITLPEIVGTNPPAANQVNVGYTLYLSTDTATGITINRAGSDTILVHGSASSVTSISIVAGDIFAKKLVAVGSNSWAVY